MGGAVAPAVKSALALLLSCTGVLVFLSLVTTTSSASSLVLAAVLIAMAAAVGRQCLAVMAPGHRLGLPRRCSDEVATLRAGRVTDTLRHPLRPRAPGLV